MKNVLLTAALLTTAASMATAAPTLTKKWETEAVLKTPESVLFDAGAKVLYVSNIDGKQPWTKDGKGSIAKVGLDGKVIAVEWVSGLEAPKGMALHDGHLFVADVDQLVVIDVAKGSIAQRIAVEGAQNLNDVTVDKAGTVYVTDSRAGKVHTVKNGTPELFLENLKGLNGVLAHGDDFYILAEESVIQVGKDKKLTKITEGLIGTADGIENIGGNLFAVSCWRGTVHIVDVEKREKHLVLDTVEQKIQAADLGVNAAERTIYVPTFFDNRVVAYEVNGLKAE